MGGYERNPSPWALDGVPAASRRACCPRTGSASRSCWRTRSAACRPWRRSRSRSSSTAPRRSRPTASSASASPTCRASGSRPASARTVSRAPAASARSWPSGSSTASPSTTLAHGHPALRPPLPQPALHPGPDVRGAVQVLRHQVPGRGEEAGRPLRVSPAYPRHAALGAVFGEKAGWERVNWYESTHAAGDEALRPRGWAGENWSPAIGAEALRNARAARAVRPVELLEARGASARARARSWSGSAPTPSTRPSARRVHADAQPSRRDRVRPLRDPARRGSLPARHRHGVRRPRPALDRGAGAEGRNRVRHRCDLGVGVLRSLGATRAGHTPAAHEIVAHERGVSLSHRAGDQHRRRAVPCGPSHVRRGAGLGALLPDRVRAASLGRAWEAGRPHGLARAATGRSTRSAWRRATGPGPPISRRSERRTRPAWPSP